MDTETHTFRNKHPCTENSHPDTQTLIYTYRPRHRYMYKLVDKTYTILISMDLDLA